MAETWVINETVDEGSFVSNIQFQSNSTTFASFELYSGEKWSRDGRVRYNGDYVYMVSDGWTDQAYRTVTFEEAPTGNLLTWLQANGTLSPSSSPIKADKLQDLIDIKQDIKEAIENKDVDLTGVDFGGYAEKIDELPAVVELTQAQYDALSVYDDNTYYLIVEEV